MARAATRDAGSHAMPSDGGIFHLVDMNLVCAKIRREGKLTIRRKSTPVRVRGILAVADNLGTAFVFHNDGFTELAVRVNGYESG